MSSRGRERLRLPRPQARAAARDVRPWLAAAALALGAALALTLAAQASAQDSDSREPRKCVILTDIDRTRVVDDDTILFYMRNGDIYRNDLPNRCPTLQSEERFMYRVATSQLCDIDVITVLSDVGFGFVPLASCGLGTFQPIDNEAAEQLQRTEN